MISVKSSAARIGLPGDFFVVRNFFGHSSVPRPLSLRTQCERVAGRFIHINVIRVGSDQFTWNDEVEIDLAVAQVERIRRIVRGLLDYARPQRQPLGGCVADLPALFEETLLLAGHSVQGGGVTIRRDWQARQAVRIGAPELQQVLLNLIVNALQALAGHGRLWLATADEQDRVVLVVADDGPGIEARHLPRVFDPFFTTRTSGTGLGLAVSFAIVRRHGGEITIGTRPGGGCLVTVCLPALEAAGCKSGADSPSCVLAPPSPSLSCRESDR